MKIDDRNLNGISASPLGRTPAAGAPAEPAGPAREDQVHLSDLAGRLRSLSSDTPERAAYLEKLSAEVEAGRYTVDAQALSRKIIADALP
jgi:anti-sigma28 factor (negative regulator of flagellin synthesis)